MIKLNIYRRDQLIDLLGGFILQVEDQMTISIQGDGSPGMSQPPGNGDLWDAGIQYQGGSRMSRVKKADLWQTASLSNSLKLRSKVRGWINPPKALVMIKLF